MAISLRLQANFIGGIAKIIFLYDLGIASKILLMNKFLF